MNQSNVHVNRRFVAVVAMAILAALALPGAASGSDTPESGKDVRILLAGGKDILWVVRCVEGEPAGKFDLIIRRPGGKWQTLRRFSGNPAAVAVWDQRLHVVSGGTKPTTSVFSLSRNENRIFLRGVRPGARWPEKNPPAAICQAPPLGASTDRRLIAVVPYETDKLSTATAASQPDPKRSGLTVLHTVEGQWKPLGSIDDIPGATGSRISAAATENRVYVLVVGKDKTTRLVTRDATDKKNAWKDVALPDKPQEPLAVSMLQGRAVLVTMAPASAIKPAPKATGIRLYIRELKAGKIAGAPQSIEDQGKPLVLPGGPIPLTCSLGKPKDKDKASERQLVLLWREGEKYRHALVNLNGEVAENKEVEELLKSPPAFDLRPTLDYLFMVIPILLLVLIVLGRRKGPVGPMVLPAQFIPGALPKRLVAMLIDSAPFMLVTFLVLTTLQPDLVEPEVLKDILAQRRVLPTDMVLCSFVFFVVWIVYGSIMESVFGATLGKMAMQLEVTSADGSKPTARQAIVRNLIRPIELSLPILIITLAMPLLTQTRQRLGDIMARTVVVEKARSTNADAPEDGGSKPPGEI